MKVLAILLALLIAHQCYSLPVVKDDSSDSSDSSDSEDIELKISEGHFSKEFIIDPSKAKKDEILISDVKGMKSNGAKKTGSVNIDSSEDDSDIDDDDEMGNFEMDSDESEIANDESSSSEQDLLVDLKSVKKQDSKAAVKTDSKPVAKQDSKPVAKQDLKPTFRKARPAGEGSPYVRVDNRDKPKQKVPFFKPKPEVAAKESTPEEFEKEIKELKEDIQRMKVLGESESAEDDEKDAGKDETVGELVKKIKSLRDEIKVEKGMPVEASNEFEDYDDSGESTSEEDDDEEVEAVKGENSSEEDGIKNIKLIQTSDGKDKPAAKQDSKPVAKQDLKPTFRKARPAGEGSPYVRVDNRDKPKQKVPFFKPKPEVAAKESTPEEFEKEIEELKKDIQRMKVLGESDSAEDDEKDEFVGELIKKIKSLRDEIRVEKGMPVEASDEFEDYDDSGESTSEEDDEDEEVEAVKGENSSEEDGINKIKLIQTFDGKDDPNEETAEKSSDDSELVKRIQNLKEEIKEKRKFEDKAFPNNKLNNESESDEDNDESDEKTESEPVDEKLLAIFQDLEVNEDLKDIKHLKVDGDEEKPMLDIEKPENLESDEVKIGFIISNEAKNSEENRFIDLLSNNAAVIPRVVDIEVFPVNIPPFEFPKNDVVELIEIVEIPDNGIPNKVGDAKKNVPNDSIIGGVFSKIGGIFSTLKKFF